MEIILAVVVIAVIFLVMQGGKFTNFKSSLMNEFGRNGISFQEADRIYTRHRDPIHAMHNAGVAVPEIVRTIVAKKNSPLLEAEIAEPSAPCNIKSIYKNGNINAVNVINDTIEMQLFLSPKKEIDANDEFAVGYLIGYTDAVLQKQNIDNNSPEGFATLVLVCINFFGEVVGTKIVNSFAYNQLNLSNQFKSGMTAGGRDVLFLAWR